MKKPQYLKLEEQNLHDWAFNRPNQWELLDCKLERARTAEREDNIEKARQIYLELIESCPEYIPALNNLGLLFKTAGDLDTAIATLKRAVEIGLACLPDEFESGIDLIPWHWEDNRAFLMAYENLGTCYLEQALEVFDHLLELNPGFHDITKLTAKLHQILRIEDKNVE